MGDVDNPFGVIRKGSPHSPQQLKSNSGLRHIAIPAPLFPVCICQRNVYRGGSRKNLFYWCCREELARFALFSPPLKTRANFEFKPTAAAARVRETVQVAQFVQCQLLN